MASRLAAAGVLVLVCALAGCSSGEDDSGATGPSAAASAAQAAARAAGADDEQIAAFDDGEITFEEYEDALGRAFTCMRDAGATVDVSSAAVRQGVTQIGYRVSGSGDSTRLAEECYEHLARYVDEHWQVSSPDAVEFDRRRAEALLPTLRDCLTSRGVDWSSDETFYDLLVKDDVPSDAETAAADDSGTTTLGQQSPARPACVEEIGFATWSG